MALLTLPVHLRPGQVPRCPQPPQAAIVSCGTPKRKERKCTGAGTPHARQSCEGLLTLDNNRGPRLRGSSPRGQDTASPQACVRPISPGDNGT